MIAEKHRKGKKEFHQYVWTCLTPALCLADLFPNNWTIQVTAAPSPRI